MKNIIIAFLLYFILPTLLTGQSWFNQQTIDCTVLLEKMENGKFIPHGTGFLIHNYDPEGKPIVVTCEHVLRNGEIYVSIQTDTAIIKFLRENRFSGLDKGDTPWDISLNCLRTKVDLVKDETFVSDELLDIAAFPIALPSKTIISNLTNEEIKVTKAKVIAKSSYKFRNGINLGDEIYFLGFPFQIGVPIDTSIYYGLTSHFGDQFINPMLRSGTISWISSETPKFLMDAFSYGGNSGSAIFKKTIGKDRAPSLIGMVIGHISLNDSNTGIAVGVWLDEILPVIERAQNLKSVVK